MKKIIFLFILFILFTSSYGQIKYDKGYFINNNNQRIECFIKNTDTRYTSNTFQFKINSNDLPQKKGIESVKEYGIYDNVKFIRFIVNIDISSNKIDKLNYDKSPKWSQKQLFLKVLVEGKAKLYYYEEEDLKRFFYSVSDTLAKQLIYKKYLIEGIVNFVSNFGWM